MTSLLIAWLSCFLGINALPVPDDQKLNDVYQIPYRLSDVKHVVVRAKINGKGPFNFVVDTGAPAVYLGNEIAQKLGMEVKEAGYWETFDLLEIEGGLKLEKLKARVEEPFQLVGMNKINAAGMRYHGVLGYTVLAQFQIEYDFTEPHLKFTRLDWTPPAPIAMGSLSEGATKNMKAMVGLSTLATSFIAKRKDATLVYRGLVGIEVIEENNQLIINKVMENTPAALAKLKTGDRLLRIDDKEVGTKEALNKAIAQLGTEQELELVVERNGEPISIQLKTARGF
ncbi:MAG TPA: PDZ domain-containing protein [Gemmatales bacterium]|nr:PDZ domain-containing protein [Gemmatales bacterium]HMP17465.1 PDZ domain-containing protein [Gemmatales bacterium]